MLACYLAAIVAGLEDYTYYSPWMPRIVFSELQF